MRSEILKASILAHEIFKRAGYTWGGTESDSYVPTFEEIATRYAYLVDRCDHSTPGTRCSTGRLLVESDEVTGSDLTFLVEVGYVERD